MKVVYLAGPIAKNCSSDARKLNIQRGLDATERILREGFLVVSPFFLANFVVGKEINPPSKKEMYDYSMRMVSVCDILVMVGDCSNSIGASHEIGFAHGRNIPVFRSVDEFIEAARRQQTS